MSVLGSELKFYLTGAESDGGIQEDANASLGDYKSSSEITTDELNNLFDDVSSAEAESGDTEYRCFAIKNTSSDILYNARLFISAEYDPGENHTISIAVERPALANATDGNAQEVVDESSAPQVNVTGHNGAGSGVSGWSTASSYASGVEVDLGSHNINLAAGELIFVWVKRVIQSSATAQSNQSFTIQIKGDTV